jgi:predicted transcriptional regulator
MTAVEMSLKHYAGADMSEITLTDNAVCWAIDTGCCGVEAIAARLDMDRDLVEASVERLMDAGWIR